MKPSGSPGAFRGRLLSCAFLAALLYLFQPCPLLIAHDQDEEAKRSSLNQQVIELCQAGKFNEAVPIAQEFLELCEKRFGPDHPETADALCNLGEVYRSLRDYVRAEPLLKRALEIDEKALGLDHPDTAWLLNNLGELYRATGDYAKAEPLLKCALEIDEKTLGPDHPDTATARDNLAALYYSMGDRGKAEALLQPALKIREESPGPENDDLAKISSLGKQVTELSQGGKYDDAIPILQQILELAEKKLGPNHLGTATALSALAELYSLKSDYAKAEPLLKRALKINEKERGPDHPDTATALNSLAVLYRSLRDYAKAEPLFHRALQIREKALGPNHSNTAQALNDMGELYRSMGDYAKAEPLFQRALQIRVKTLGPDHPDTAQTLDFLAGLYRSTGNYAKAEPLLQRALQIKERALGPDHRGTATALNHLGGLYSSVGDYARAEPLLQHSLKIEEKTLGPDHPDTVQTLNSLAQLYYLMGDYAKAELFFQRVLKIEEKALGLDQPDTANALNNLALLYNSVGDYAKAESLFQRALKIEEKTLGPDHRETATALNNLAGLYSFMRDYNKAEPLFQRALKIKEKALGPDHPETAVALNNLAGLYSFMRDYNKAEPLFQRALKIVEKVLGPDHPDTGKTLNNLGELYGSMGDYAKAEPLFQRSLKIEEKALGPHHPDTARVLDNLALLKIDGLARKVAGLGKARRALSITVPQVQAVLPKQTVLIELLRYSHYLGKTKSEDSYGAGVISPNGEPKWVSLGTAAEIEKAVKLYQKSVRGKTDEATLAKVLKALEQRVWAPIEKALPAETKTVIISPDGELSFVSFATLLTPDDRFLAEKYAIQYVASGRDLLRESTPSGSPTTVVFANPDFGSQAIAQAPASSSAVALRSLEMRDLQSMRLSALPDTAREAADLEKREGKAAKVFLGPNATEAELRQVSSPRILHLATHGFFLPEVELGKQAKPLLQPIELGKQTNPLQFQPGEIPKIKLENPMYRNGLALAGAQRTFKAWSEGEVPPIENDGIVTAEEVGGLKLNDTWLVVLSACDTGSGEARAGEGVMGLRRGFIQAGAQNLLMTLWPINDQATVKIMLDFYEAADKSHNAPQALAEVQRDALVELRSQHGREHSLLDAVRLAGSFIMTSQGKP